jgi:hypothetical protein
LNASPYPAFSTQFQISGPLEEQRSYITTLHVRNVTLGYSLIYSLIFTICSLQPLQTHTTFLQSWQTTRKDRQSAWRLRMECMFSSRLVNTSTDISCRVNPSGAIILAAAPMYLALVPLTSYLTKPDSICQSLTHALIKLLPGVGVSSITAGRAIPALSALYLFWTFGASGAASAAGQAMSREEGFDNDHPRKHVHNMDGFPLRLRSAHYALMENFPGTYHSCFFDANDETDNCYSFCAGCGSSPDSRTQRCANCKSTWFPCHGKATCSLPFVPE